MRSQSLAAAAFDRWARECALPIGKLVALAVVVVLVVLNLWWWL